MVGSGYLLFRYDLVGMGFNLGQRHLTRFNLGKRSLSKRETNETHDDYTILGKILTGSQRDLRVMKETWMSHRERLLTE